VRLTDARAHEAGDPRGSADEIGDAPGRHEKMGRGSLGVWNHVVRLARASAVLVLFLAAGCGPEPTGAAETPRPPAESPTRAPDHAELAFVEVPSAIRLNGRFRVVVELRDGAAVATTDHESRVTISASGPGTLGGTLVQMAASGRVVFDDLSYDRWAPITLTVAAEGRRSASTSVPIPVRPLLRFVRRPPNRFVVGEDAGKFEIELVDGAGRAVKSDQPLRLALDPEEADVADGPERPLAAGPATFASLRFKTAGQKSLVWTCPGVADLLHGVIVYAEQRERGQWLPAARVGVPYRAMLEPAGAEFRLVRGALPKGLSFERGAVEGVPTTSQYARFEVLATVEGESPWLSRVELPIYPAREPVLPPLDDLGPPGPHAVETRSAPRAPPRARSPWSCSNTERASSMPRGRASTTSATISSSTGRRTGSSSSRSTGPTSCGRTGAGCPPRSTTSSRWPRTCAPRSRTSSAATATRSRRSTTAWTRRGSSSPATRAAPPRR
jgi:hypothetical protein